MSQLFESSTFKSVKSTVHKSVVIPRQEIVTTFPMSEKVTLVQNCTESPAQLTQVRLTLHTCTISPDLTWPYRLLSHKSVHLSVEFVVSRHSDLWLVFAASAAQNPVFSECGLVQSSEVATQLLKHQKCAQQLQAEASEAFCNAFILNRDVLLHLVSLCALIGWFKHSHLHIREKCFSFLKG